MAWYWKAGYWEAGYWEAGFWQVPGADAQVPARVEVAPPGQGGRVGQQAVRVVPRSPADPGRGDRHLGAAGQVGLPVPGGGALVLRGRLNPGLPRVRAAQSRPRRRVHCPVATSLRSS